MCFETALILAYLSNRCLVTPDIYRSHHQSDSDHRGFRPLHPEEFFDLESLRGIVKIVSHDEYARCAGPEASLDCDDLIFEPGTAVFCYPGIPAPDSPDASRLHWFAAGRQRFLEFTRSMQTCATLHVKNATLEHFYSFFYFSHAEDERRCHRLIRDRVKFQPEVISTASNIAARLGNFGAVHVRRNDFFGQYAEQNISADRLLPVLAARLPAGARLYIATDEPDKAFFSIIRCCYDVYFLQDFESAIPPGMPAASLACVEQMICAFAGIFIGTRLSTFSGYINRLRGYYGAPDKNIYFTDGFPGSEMDDAGSPPFSWINWMRDGHPWWGREFREGWEPSRR
jgi:hypothetical protein